MACRSLICSCLIVLTFFGLVGADYIEGLCKVAYASKGRDQAQDTEKTTTVEAYAKDILYDDGEMHSIAIIYKLKCYAKPKPLIVACTVKRGAIVMILRVLVSMVNTVKAGTGAVRLKGDYSFECFPDKQSEVTKLY